MREEIVERALVTSFVAIPFRRPQLPAPLCALSTPNLPEPPPNHRLLRGSRRREPVMMFVPHAIDTSDPACWDDTALVRAYDHALRLASGQEDDGCNEQHVVADDDAQQVSEEANGVQDRAPSDDSPIPSSAHATPTDRHRAAVPGPSTAVCSGSIDASSERRFLAEEWRGVYEDEVRAAEQHEYDPSDGGARARAGTARLSDRIPRSHPEYAKPSPPPPYGPPPHLHPRWQPSAYDGAYGGGAPYFWGGYAGGGYPHYPPPHLPPPLDPAAANLYGYASYPRPSPRHGDKLDLGESRGRSDRGHGDHRGNEGNAPEHAVWKRARDLARASIGDGSGPVGGARLTELLASFYYAGYQMGSSSSVSST